jgi:acyl-CoA thioesterase-1
MQIRLVPILAAIVLLAACTSQNEPPAEGVSARDGSSPATSSPLPAQPAPAARKNIVFFGNSLTAAYNLAPEQGFPAQIQRKIDSLGLPYNCINAGLSGETTAGGNSRVDWVLKQPVDVFVLELGANDALRGLDLAASKRNLQSIIDKVRAKYPDCRLVIAGMLAPPELGERYTAQFRDMYVDLARSNNAALVPFLLEGVATIAEYNLEDRMHPNARGQKIVAENVWRVLRPVLEGNS